jgi:hypothetical protein
MLSEKMCLCETCLTEWRCRTIQRASPPERQLGQTPLEGATPNCSSDNRENKALNGIYKKVITVTMSVRANCPE